MRLTFKATWSAGMILALVPTFAWSDTVATQNTFQPGETARAAEVNENFTP